MAKYFYSESGRTRGPVSPKEIMDLILDDRLTVDSSVMDSSNPIWRRIREIPALMRYLHESDLKLGFSDDELVLDAEDTSPWFYYQPVWKLVLLSLLSFGWYELYWFYRNWKYLRRTYARKTSSSFWRDAINPSAIAGVFYSISADKDLRPESGWEDFSVYGWLWMLSLLLLSLFSSGMAFLFLGAGWAIKVIATLVALVGSVFCLLPVQVYINAANSKAGKHYARPGFGYYTLLVLGILETLIILGGVVPALLKLVR